MQILLWEIRTNKGFSLRKLADATGISKTALNDIENQKVSPTLIQLEAMAKGLGVRITDLFESDYK